MRIHVGSQVNHPELQRVGTVVDIHTNPACLLRQLVVEWDDGEIEELEELEFGPLED
ncbi:hypothetical protein [Alicyclobacillus sp. SO9]|uniref:hypothetical protein n=1 Tax=Alicyclobacillus sp. SO9 TaxID=2665646 RepID=UPI0018E7806C|nr:hypothetical protein [Alicyclobacillus sp. SO9]QQE80179.1 hypothetical protein GI364_07035 [Alicyclobacillus sp. SO9]